MINKKISVIIPCYNEEENILDMYKRLVITLQKITNNYEIIYINNGSLDNSQNILEKLSKEDPKVTTIELSRNFGSSQQSITCGLEYATGDCAFILDGDLQDPPELLESMVQKWEEGYKIVYGVREIRKDKNIIKKVGYKLFYKIYKKLSYIDMPLDSGDFSLIDRKIIDIINAMPEKNRFIRGLRSWAGFESIGIKYTREERKKGKTSNSFMDNIRWAKTGIVSFSFAPLEMISNIAIIMTMLTFFSLIGYVIFMFINKNTSKIFPTLLIVILFFGTIVMISLSILGEYMKKIFEEVKSRPEYIVKKIINDHR